MNEDHCTRETFRNSDWPADAKSDTSKLSSVLNSL